MLALVKVRRLPSHATTRLTISAASRIPSRDDLRAGAESSLSYRCDPKNQPPPTPEPSFVNLGMEESVKSSPPVKENHPDEDKPDEKKTESRPQRLNTIRRRAHRLRPRSWLPFSRSSPNASYPRSASSQLPKTASSSTVARSVISAPILTSTTNVSVARTEGVYCEDMSDLDFSQTARNLQAGQVVVSSQHSGEASQGQSGEAASPQPIPGNVSDKRGDPLVSKKGRLLRLGNAIRSKISHGVSHQQTPASSSSQENKKPEPSDSPGGIDLSRDASRRRAETINLYKEKIKGLTGREHVRQRSLGASIRMPGSTNDVDPPLLADAVDGATDGTHGVDLPATDLVGEQSENESPFGSLTRSFASAVDKLDLHWSLPRNMSFIRSKSSIFNLRKGDKDDTSSPQQGRRDFPPISPSRPAPPISQPIAASPPSQLPSGESSGLPGAPQDSTHSILKTMAPKVQTDSHSSHRPHPMVFSNVKNGYVASNPIPGYPGGVNPLRMHPPDTMAIDPSIQSRTPRREPPVPNRPARPLATYFGGPSTGSQPQSPTSLDGDESSDSGSLEGAPIYSPSLGDLSQYSRETPKSVSFSPAGKGRIADAATPTREPIKSNAPVRGGPVWPLKKSKSGVGLFSRSKNDNNASKNGPQGSGSSALSEGDANQKMGIGSGKGVKKSRSLHFGGLFKRDEHTDLLPNMPPAPFQPATPSPLRKVVRCGSSSTKEGNSPTAQTARK